jgi:hypothetical protein
MALNTKAKPQVSNATEQQRNSSSARFALKPYHRSGSLRITNGRKYRPSPPQSSPSRRWKWIGSAGSDGRKVWLHRRQHASRGSVAGCCRFASDIFHLQGLLNSPEYDRQLAHHAEPGKAQVPAVSADQEA